MIVNDSSIIEVLWSAQSNLHEAQQTSQYFSEHYHNLQRSLPSGNLPWQVEPVPNVGGRCRYRTRCRSITGGHWHHAHQHWSLQLAELSDMTGPVYNQINFCSLPYTHLTRICVTSIGMLTDVHKTVKWPRGLSHFLTTNLGQSRKNKDLDNQVIITRHCNKWKLRGFGRSIRKDFFMRIANLLQKTFIITIHESGEKTDQIKR